LDQLIAWLTEQVTPAERLLARHEPASVKDFEPHRAAAGGPVAVSS
jgi:hypothetical protein